MEDQLELSTFKRGVKNMTKQFYGLFVLIFLHSTAVLASADGRVKGTTAFERSRMVLSRGLTNMGSLSLELKRTAILEKENHTKVWPVSAPPRMLTNLFFRMASATHDTFFFPWYAPFTNDLSPWTEAMGLPEYPWEED